MEISSTSRRTWVGDCTFSAPCDAIFISIVIVIGILLLLLLLFLLLFYYYCYCSSNNKSKHQSGHALVVNSFQK